MIFEIKWTEGMEIEVRTPEAKYKVPKDVAITLGLNDLLNDFLLRLSDYLIVSQRLNDDF